MVASFDRRLVHGIRAERRRFHVDRWVREDDGQPVDHARLAMFADLLPLET